MSKRSRCEVALDKKRAALEHDLGVNEWLKCDLESNLRVLVELRDSLNEAGVKQSLLIQGCTEDRQPKPK